MSDDAAKSQEAEVPSSYSAYVYSVPSLEPSMNSQALGEFVVALRGVEQGQHLDVPYELFEVLFPPGLRDDPAREAASAFAQRRGFVLENRPDKHAVRFVKDADRS